MSEKKNGKVVKAVSGERPFCEADKLSELWKTAQESPESPEKPCVFSKSDLAFMISNLEKRVEACEQTLQYQAPKSRSGSTPFKRPV